MNKVIAVTLSFLLCCNLFAQKSSSLYDYIRTEDSLQISYLNRAKPFLDKGYPYTALKILKKGIRKSPDFYEAHLFVGTIYGALGKKEKAINYLTLAIQLDPSQAVTYFIRGNLHLNQDLYRSALADYQRCIRRDSTFYMAYNNMAMIRLFNQGGSGNVHLNDFKLAQRDLMDMMRRTKFADEDVFFNIALVHLELDDYYIAGKFFDKCLNLDSTYAKAYFYRGITKFKQQRFEGAIVDFQRAERMGYEKRQSQEYLSFIDIILKQ